MHQRNVFLIVLAALVVGGAIGFALRGDGSEAKPRENDAPAAAKAEIWTCSMHPQIQLPEPGLCPICNMALIPLATGGPANAGPRTLVMSEGAAQLAEIQTATVIRRPVSRELRLVGKVAYDESRLATLTAWVDGRLERLFVDYTGVSVRPGDHMVEIYSPALFTEQKIYLEALATAKKLEASTSVSIRKSAQSTVNSAREKLRRLGLTETQILEIESRGTPEDTVEITAPIGGIVVHKNALEGMYVKEGAQIFRIADLSHVWVMLEAYESDLVWLRYGQEVEFEVAAYPGETFAGTITFIDPVLDDRTRTVRVRVNVANPALRLKPDMFARATVMAELGGHGKMVAPSVADLWICPMHPEIVSAQEADCSVCGMALVPARELGFEAETALEPPLVIPASAPLITGKRAVVYVRVPNQAQPTFEGREIVLGPRAGDYYVVQTGLAVGEEVVFRGAFKLDSELQIRAAPSMMYPSGVGKERHDEAPVKRHAAPEAFQRELGAVVLAYVTAQTALASDDFAAATAAARAIDDALAAVDMSQLDGDAHLAWMDNARALGAASDRYFEAEDISARRQAFEPLTTALIAAVSAFGTGQHGADLGVFFCPMAFDDAGASWIQAGTTVANPYFGAAMLRCGERQRDLLEQH